MKESIKHLPERTQEELTALVDLVRFIMSFLHRSPL